MIGTNEYEMGSGKSKQLAEQEAAAKTLEKIQSTAEVVVDVQ
jgi:dsRNA-specific ribonuclease